MKSSTGKSKAKASAPRKHQQGAARLKALREQMGWSPELLGMKAGVSGKWIRHIERSGVEPGEGVKARLARPFGMLPWDIWTPAANSPLAPHDIERLRELVAA